MSVKILTSDGKWREETKEEVMEKVDIEGNRACDLCWERARSHGMYVWPLTVDKKYFDRCSCGRMLGVKGNN